MCPQSWYILSFQPHMLYMSLDMNLPKARCWNQVKTNCWTWGGKQAIDWYLSYLKQQVQTDLSHHIQYVINNLTHSQYEEVLAANSVLYLASYNLLYTHILAWLVWNAAETCNFCSPEQWFSNSLLRKSHLRIRIYTILNHLSTIKWWDSKYSLIHTTPSHCRPRI